MANTAAKSKNKKQALKIKNGSTKFHAVKFRNRCAICGRPRGYIGRFHLCRICFRQRALNGELPGVKIMTWWCTTKWYIIESVSFNKNFIFTIIMTSDPIADLLSRIRNAQLRKKDTISLPSTKMLVAIVEILKREGFIAEYKVEEAEPQAELTVTLKYVNGTPAFRELVRVSKPGVRKYRGYKSIKPIMNGLGVAIFSTPMGVISGQEAVKSKVGGEYICYVY